MKTVAVLNIATTDWFQLGNHARERMFEACSFSPTIQALSFRRSVGQYASFLCVSKHCSEGNASLLQFIHQVAPVGARPNAMPLVRVVGVAEIEP
jgi:hypothetical protein